MLRALSVGDDVGMEAEIVVPVVTAAVSFGAGWFVEWLRTRSARKHERKTITDGRRYDQSHRQLEAVSRMLDDIRALETDYTDDPNGELSGGIVNWENPRLAELDKEVEELIDKARRHTYEDCDAELAALAKRWHEGVLEVSKGHSTIIDAQRAMDDGKAMPDLRGVIPLKLWLASFKVLAEESVRVAKREVGKSLSG